MSERDHEGRIAPFTITRHEHEVLHARVNVPAQAVLLEIGYVTALLTADEATALGLWLSNAAQDVRTGFPFREAEQAGGE